MRGVSQGSRALAVSREITLANRATRPDAVDLECNGFTVNLRNVYEDEVRVILKNDMAGTFFEVNKRGLFPITARWATMVMSRGDR